MPPQEFETLEAAIGVRNLGAPPEVTGKRRESLGFVVHAQHPRSRRRRWWRQDGRGDGQFNRAHAHALGSGRRIVGDDFSLYIENANATPRT
jgi:hypothetical protein